MNGDHDLAPMLFRQCPEQRREMRDMDIVHRLHRIVQDQPGQLSRHRQMQCDEQRERGSVEITNDVDEAFDGAEVIYAKSWGGKQFYGNTDRDLAERAQYRGQWIVNEDRMSRTNQAIFMHCLPVRRNVIVTDGVIDSAASVVIEEAENRLHVQKAVMAEIL